MRWSEKYRAFILPGLAILVMAVVMLTVNVKQTRALIEDAQGIGELKQRHGKIVQKANLLKSLDAAELEGRTLTLLQGLPADNDLGYFLTAVRSTVERAGLNLAGIKMVGGSTIEPKTKKEAEATEKKQTAGLAKMESLEFEAELSGSFLAWQKFLFEADSSLPLVEVESFSFGGSGSSYGGEVKLKYYYAQLPEMIGAASDPLPVVTGAEDEAYLRLVDFSRLEIEELPRVPTGNPQLILP